MKTIYIYVLDTLADWELGYIIAELNSRRFFKEDASSLTIKTVSDSKNPIKTMGGLLIYPDLLVKDITVNKKDTLLLPGADTWNNPRHLAILEKAAKFISLGATVGAICGATVALADYGLLNQRYHTSNGPGFLEMFSSKYAGKGFYLDQPSVSSDNMITAGPTAALLWTKQIIEALDVFSPQTLEAWYAYFSTGDSNNYFTLMQTLPIKN